MTPGKGPLEKASLPDLAPRPAIQAATGYGIVEHSALQGRWPHCRHPAARQRSTPARPMCGRTVRMRPSRRADPGSRMCDNVPGDRAVTGTGPGATSCTSIGAHAPRTSQKSGGIDRNPVNGSGAARRQRAGLRNPGRMHHHAFRRAPGGALHHRKGQEPCRNPVPCLRRP